MKYLLALVTMVSMPAFAADLSTSDMTGITFWLVTRDVSGLQSFSSQKEMWSKVSGKLRYQ